MLHVGKHKDAQWESESKTLIQSPSNNVELEVSAFEQEYFQKNQHQEISWQCTMFPAKKSWGFRPCTASTSLKSIFWHTVWHRGYQHKDYFSQCQFIKEHQQNTRGTTKNPRSSPTSCKEPLSPQKSHRLGAWHHVSHTGNISHLKNRSLRRHI